MTRQPAGAETRIGFLTPSLNGISAEVSADLIADSVAEIVDQGFARDTVLRIQRMLFIAEYKRRQAPPGVKITRKSFGRDRRYPLTNAFREEPPR